jgi:hypothetical protein
LKKRSKKLLFTTAFEWPQYGRSHAAGNKSFCALFSKSAAYFSFVVMGKFEFRIF